MSLYYNMNGEPVSLDERMDIWKGTNDDIMAGRRVATDTILDSESREHFVSTVLLGLDHSFGEGPPLIFETMVFCHHDDPCEWSDWQDRYSSKESAEAGHAHVLRRLTQGLPS
jgi:hypothetical protein